MFRRSVLAISAFALAAPLAAQDAPAPEPLTLADTRAELSGEWIGELQYRDYQADRWFGIPVTVNVDLIGDGATVIRKGSFDDGPETGTVYITVVSMLGPDGATEYVGSYRADRPAEHGSFTVTLESAEDAQNWTIRAEQDGYDDNRPARIRETTTRTGDSLVTLKEVDFTDDEGEEWLSRNRTVLERVGG